MKLSDWLKNQDPPMKATAFAKLSDLDVSTISRVISGERRPDWETMGKILAATNGEVTPNDFIPESDGAEERGGSSGQADAEGATV